MFDENDLVCASSSQVFRSWSAIWPSQRQRTILEDWSSLQTTPQRKPPHLIATFLVYGYVRCYKTLDTNRTAVRNLDVPFTFDPRSICPRSKKKSLRCWTWSILRRKGLWVYRTFSNNLRWHILCIFKYISGLIYRSSRFEHFIDVLFSFHMCSLDIWHDNTLVKVRPSYP